MTIDFTRLSSVAAGEAKKREDRIYNRLARITSLVGDRLQGNENDPNVEAIEVLLGIKPGGNEKAAELLGLTSDPAPEASEPPAKNKGYMPAFEHDGTPLGTGFKSEEDAKAAGFEVWLETDGTIKGWRKPAPKPIPAPASADKVKVVDKHGKPVDLLEYKDYEDNASEYQVLETDPTTHLVKKVRELPRFGFTRK